MVFRDLEPCIKSPRETLRRGKEGSQKFFLMAFQHREIRVGEEEPRKEAEKEQRVR